jgi:formate dehydrogenase major subunit
MVNITIDGINISADENLTILEAAQQADIRIPTLCYLKDVNEIGACKMCVVEIEGKNNLVTSCNTKVKEGMVITTNSPRVISSRKQVLNLILANHDVRCFSCGKSGDCRLQDLSNEYEVTRSCYTGNQVKVPAKLENPFLTYYPELCINCQRCVSTCNKVACNGVLHNGKLGTRTLIEAPFGADWKETQCENCGNCAQACPTGALIAKNRKKYQVGKVSKVLTTCPHCATGCQYYLVVKDNKIVDVEPANGPSNKNLLCVK